MILNGAHHILTTFPFTSAHSHTRMIPMHKILKYDVCGMVVVVIVLSILWIECIVVVRQNGMVHHHHLLTK